MKKNLMLTLMLMTLTNCATQHEADDRLVGTSWVATNFSTMTMDVDVCEFISTSQVNHYYSLYDEIIDGTFELELEGTFEYELDYPTLVIHHIDSEGWAIDYNFTFTDSHTMVLEGNDNSNFSSIYIRHQ